MTDLESPNRAQTGDDRRTEYLREFPPGHVPAQTIARG